MICDTTEQIDFRELFRRHEGALPRVFLVGTQRFDITWTRTNFGGRRPWVRCPKCRGPRAILYRPNRDDRWACRLCLNGRYRTEHKSALDRRYIKARKIRQRLGQKDANLFAPFPAKPKGMWWRTYDRIRGEALALESALLRDGWGRLGRGQDSKD